VSYGQGNRSKIGNGYVNNEYKFRFEKQVNHKSYDVILTLPMPDLPKLGLTERPQAMPDEFKVPEDPIAAYRNFYLYGKTAILAWKKRGRPEWCHS
jgi:hypothetical protein